MFMSFGFTRLVVRQAFETPAVKNIIRREGKKVKHKQLSYINYVFITNEQNEICLPNIFQSCEEATFDARLKLT